MIVSLHVATGAALGAAAGTRSRAAAVGLLAHLLGDRVPHQDIAWRNFELASGVAGITLVALSRGLTHPATIGALAASAPDLEHPVRLPRPGGRKLFPSHRFPRWHRSGGLPASVQLLAAGVLLGLLARPGSAALR